MIYFVVAQLDGDGEWYLFGPWDYIEGADKKIVELDQDNKYCQVDVARVLTDEDGPDQDDWEKHNDKLQVFRCTKLEHCSVKYKSDQDTKDFVYEKVLAWFLRVGSFSGECIYQRDAPQIEAPELLVDLAENVFEFDVTHDEDDV